MIDNIMIDMNWAIRFRDELMSYPQTLEEIKWICRNKQITFFKCLYVYETTIRELMKAEKAERERRVKLIDADKLVARWESLFNKDGKPVAVMFTNAAINDVKREPTVEAIPISWLEDFRDGLDTLSENRLMAAIDLIIDAYRAEKKREEE